jgi:hypothetical protein
MSTTPLWVPILVAGLGVCGTLGGAIAGVLVNQRRSDRREDARWQREQEAEEARWMREDALRTFEHRREAYMDFYESVRELALTAYNFGMGLTDFTELDPDWQLPTYRKLQHLQVYATDDTWEAASEAYSAAWWWGDESQHGHDDDPFYKRQERFDKAQVWLLTMIRRDLSIWDEA